MTRACTAAPFPHRYNRPLHDERYQSSSAASSSTSPFRQPTDGVLFRFTPLHLSIAVVRCALGLSLSFFNS